MTFEYTYTQIEKKLAAGEKLVIKAGLKSDISSGTSDSGFKSKDSYIYNSADFCFYKKATISTPDDLVGTIHSNISSYADTEKGFFYLARNGSTFRLGTAGNTRSCKINFEYLTSAGKGEKEIAITPTGGPYTCNKELFNLDIGSATMVRGSCYINGDQLYKESGLKNVVFYEVDSTADCKVTYAALDKITL